MIFNRSKRAEIEKAENFYSALHKNRVYNEDLLPREDRDRLLSLEERYERALKARNVHELETLKKEAEPLCNRLFPPQPAAVWRENVEVFVVAIVVALAVRTYFLQPFKIPTGSMEPTLNGVQTTVIKTPPPNFLVRVLEFPLLGRTYTSLESKNGGEITEMRSGELNFRLFNFEFTDVTIGGEVCRVWINRTQLEYKFGVWIGNVYPPGTILNFQVDTGDQVLVNKMVYNFRKPKRGEVFVFKTTNIAAIEGPRQEEGQEGSQYYIKRCVGVPGDFLSIDPPYLKLNGNVLHEPKAFDRIYSMKEGYHGYVIKEEQQFLTSPKESYQVHPDSYWAMGDNSPNSFDSRYWGPVPRENLVGTGWFVYWPFTSHWGWIR